VFGTLRKSSSRIIRTHKIDPIRRFYNYSKNSRNLDLFEVMNKNKKLLFSLIIIASSQLHPVSVLPI